ncbi:acyltransferase family protein [Ciceribacter azotifigens]|uniref:acyltransferase family protein n=1 Tax=Ciceribacter azotifigens TaxID=2069303 RepID=UPI003A8BB813
MPVITRRSDIQGLRAVAVLAVICFHAFPRGPLPGGFIGVDIFFVISGFLITNVIRSAHRDDKFSFLDFYRRRARRLLPALTLVVFCTLCAGYFLLSPGGYLHLARSVLPAFAFVSNFYFANNVGYFDAAAETQPLLHTWSLSVEEQFYLWYPILLIAVLKRGESTRLRSLLALTLAGLALSEALVRYDPDWSYFASPSRAFELFIGCFAALLTSRTVLTARAADLVSAAGGTLVAASLLIISDSASFPGLSAAMPCIGTAAILVAGATHRPIVSRILSNPVLVSVGNVSYSMYLWHWPFLAFARTFWGLDLPLEVAGSAVLMTIVASYISYRWVEQPFLKPTANLLPVFRLAGASFLAMAILSLAIRQADGVPGRFSPEANALFASSKDISPERARCHASSRRPLRQEDNCVFGDLPPETAVWGDSHGVELAYALGEREKRPHHGVVQITLSACPPVLGYEQPGRPLCAQHNAASLKTVVATESIRTVVLSAYLQNPKYGDRALLLEGYEKTVRALADAHKAVVLVVPIPTYDIDIPDRLGIYSAMGLDPATVGMPRDTHEQAISSIRDFMLGLASKYPNTTVFDPASELCDAVMCHAYSEARGALYFNKDHISLAAARSLADRLSTTIEGATSERQVSVAPPLVR